MQRKYQPEFIPFVKKTYDQSCKSADHALKFLTWTGAVAALDILYDRTKIPEIRYLMFVMGGFLALAFSTLFSSTLFSVLDKFAKKMDWNWKDTTNIGIGALFLLSIVVSMVTGIRLVEMVERLAFNVANLK